MKHLTGAVVILLASAVVSSTALAQYVELWKITSTTGPDQQSFDLGDTDGGYPVQQAGSQGAWAGTLAHSSPSLAMPGLAGIHPTPPGSAFLPNTVYGNTDGDPTVEFVSFEKAGDVCQGVNAGTLLVWDGATGLVTDRIPVNGLPQCAVVRYIVLVDVNAGDGRGRAEIIIHWNDTPTNAYGPVCYGNVGPGANAPAEGQSGAGLLRQNAPNPFRGATRIQYTLPSTTRVDLKIYDVQGRLMRTLSSGRQTAGFHAAEWDGRDAAGAMAAPGTYYYELVTEAGRQSREAIRLQ